MLRILIYAVLVYIALLGVLAYDHAPRFFYWLGVCSVSTFVGAFIGTMFGEIHLKELQDD